YLGLVDEILVMTVHPGFGGQAFMTEVLPKIATIRQMAPDLPVSIDGGVTLNSAPLCAEQGASILIAGTALFKAADMAADIRAMRDACHAAYPSASI
ncbi:MAG: ribulose-phosphate 3-epimerase, partial [Kiritimatiellia bacterium]